MAHKLDRLLVNDRAHDVHWLFNGHTHTVQYGLQTKTFYGAHSELRAAKEYGECIAHSLACEGHFDKSTY
jgi:hypothetical protein